MLRVASPGVTTLAAFILILCGCGLESEKIRTYALGERVQAGPLVYDAFDTRWFLTLGPPSSPRIPASRFLIVHLDVANGGATEANNLAIFGLARPAITNCG